MHEQTFSLCIHGMRRRTDHGGLTALTSMLLLLLLTTTADSSMACPVPTSIINFMAAGNDLTVQIMRLLHVVLQGTLLIDPTAPSLSLDANYILLRGGTLRAGLSHTQHHQGNFTITLWGDQHHARRLPTFGAKVSTQLTVHAV